MTATLPEFLFHWAERTPDMDFVTEPDRGPTYTYGQVARSVGRFRAQLQRLGVKRGDRVAILADNSCAWIVAYLGTMAQGAVAAPLNTRHAASDLDRVLDDLDPAVIVGDPPYLPRLSECHRSRTLVFAPTRHCWGTWIYDCVTEPEVQRTLPRIVSIDGAPCHPFWSFPATKEDLLDNILVARQVSRVSPAAGYATIGRDELAALYVVSSALKREGKGEYFERVREYVRRFQREKPYFDKYYAGATGTAEERMRLFRFIRDLTASEYAGWWDVKIIHGSGSPAAEWLQMYREYDLGRAAKHVDALVTGR